ncbi:MAG: hypothetical protein RR902_00600 [Oscillospiraceae bacterium]
MSKSVLFNTARVTFALSIVFFLFYIPSGFNLPVFIGLVIGNVVSCLCLYLMYLTVYKRHLAIFFHILRVVIMFGSVIICAFVKQIDAVGAIMPIIISIPTLAIITAKHKGDED